jgi:membrane protein YqaA with SNARE-associated domain
MKKKRVTKEEFSLVPSLTLGARVLPLVPFVLLSVIFFWLGPTTIISWMGVENSYVLLALVSFIGGLSTLSGVPYQLVLITLAAGGLNPLYLGLVSATAVTLGDSSSYLVGYYGRTLFGKHLERLQYFVTNHPRLLPLGIFFYGTIVPISSDIITIPLGFLRYPMWKVLLPLGVGTLIFNIGLAYMAVYAHSYLSFVL